VNLETPTEVAERVADDDGPAILESEVVTGINPRPFGAVLVLQLLQLAHEARRDQVREKMGHAAYRRM
jgi:hypothetical protein